MDREKALDFLGGSGPDRLKKAAEAIGCTRQAFNDWPNPLPRRIADRVLAAAVRLGRPIPPELLAEAGESAQAA